MTTDRYGTIFTADLDGTVIYSNRHEFHAPKTCVETIGDSYQAYMNKNLYDNLKEYDKTVPFIPVTSRSPEQYERIKFPFVPDYALLLNGALLYHKGRSVIKWEEETRKKAARYKDRLESVMEAAKSSIIPCKIIRFMDGFFVFIKTELAGEMKQMLQNILGPSSGICVYQDKKKVYAVPDFLNKGAAVMKLKEMLGAHTVIAAGNSDMDASMLRAADRVVACRQLKEEGKYL